MISKFNQWLGRQLADSQAQSEQIEPSLATAVLFYEVIRADHHIADDEIQLMTSMLVESNRITKEEAQALLIDARQQAEQAVDLVQFTRILHSQYDYAKKCQLLHRLWCLAYADNCLEPDEDYIIRKIADLLYIDHTDFVRTKLKAKEQRT